VTEEVTQAAERFLAGHAGAAPAITANHQISK